MLCGCQQLPIRRSATWPLWASTCLNPRSWSAYLMSSDQDDFGKHINPGAIHKVGVFAHTFEGYWEDIGTIRSFYEANLALTDQPPPFNFYRADAPIYTHARFLSGHAAGELPH